MLILPGFSFRVQGASRTAVEGAVSKSYQGNINIKKQLQLGSLGTILMLILPGFRFRVH
jgi:hypothetical protein